ATSKRSFFRLFFFATLSDLFNLSQQTLKLLVVRLYVHRGLHYLESFVHSALRQQQVHIAENCFRAGGRQRKSLPKSEIGFGEHSLLVRRVFGIANAPSVNSSNG